MRFKRLPERSGYNGTVQRILEGNPKVVWGVGAGKEGYLELLCQMEICRRVNGYYARLCDETYHCIGVPFCSKEELEKRR